MSHLNELDAMFMDITRACRLIGYGRMMQIISDAWRAELKSKYGTDTGAFEGTPVGAYAAAIARVERLENALREYADRKNWYAKPGEFAAMSFTVKDDDRIEEYGGEIASAALEAQP